MDPWTIFHEQGGVRRSMLCTHSVIHIEEPSFHEGLMQNQVDGSFPGRTALANRVRYAPMTPMDDHLS